MQNQQPQQQQQHQQQQSQPQRTRRAHTKSRLGCTECKQLKIKCDQQKPRCGRCEKKDIPCSLEFLSVARRPFEREHTTPSASASSSKSLSPNRETAQAAAQYPRISPRPQSPRSPSTLQAQSRPPPAIYENTRPVWPDHALGPNQMKGSDSALPPAPPKLPPFQDATSLPAPHSSYTLQDFRLFHHYVTSTYITMAAVPSMQHVWRDTIPGISFSHGFLLQSILATSALHVAHERTPELSTGLMLQPGDMDVAIARSGLTEQDKEDRKNLLATARSLYDSALPKFRVEMENVNPGNCDALFAFSVLLLPYICATERNELRESGFSGSLLFNHSASVGQQERERASSHMSSLLRWVYLVLGVKPVVQVARPFIWNGALFRWLYRHDWNAWPQLDCIEAQQDTAHLDELESLWGSSPEDWAHAVDENEAAVYSECLKQLKRTVALVYSPTHNPHVWWEREKARKTREEGDMSALEDEEPQDVGHNRAKMTWMFLVPETFWSLLAVRTPQALIIFAHFGALIAQHATGPWWIEGFGRDIVLAIYGILRAELEDQSENWRGDRTSLHDASGGQMALDMAGGIGTNLGNDVHGNPIPRQSVQQQRQQVGAGPTQAPQFNLTTPGQPMTTGFQPQAYDWDPTDTEMGMDTFGLDLDMGGVPANAGSAGATPGAGNIISREASTAATASGVEPLGKLPADADPDVWAELGRWQEAERRKQFWVNAMEWPLRRAELIK